MNFCDERYVPFFTRETLGWLRLPWEGKCLLPLLLRRIPAEQTQLEIDDVGAVVAAQLYTGGPREFVSNGLAGLLSQGLVEEREGFLRFPIQEQMVADSSERYVRLYVRNTTTWHRLGWEGQCMLPLILRCVDRAGVLDIGDLSPANAIAMHTGGPIEFVSTGVAALLELGVLEHRGESVLVPRFVEAQETPKSDKLRQRESRERRRRSCGSRVLSDNDKQLEIPELTLGASRDVTGCHSQPTEFLSPAGPNQTTTVPAALEHAPAQVEFSQPTVVVSLAEWSERTGSEVSRAAKTGVDWFQQLLADVATPPLFSFRPQYEYIGSRPAPERAKVAEHIRRTEWCAANRRKVTPAHVVRYWSDYLEGPRNFQLARQLRAFVGPSEVPSDDDYAAERAAAAAGTFGAQC
jgi:hypothetical protein